ncbi:hypothetical protein DFH07DRAFT_744469, partial [Mycena maculata]
AGNAQFRVYRGVLAARSPVFQDMLSFPQPADSDIVEGCPLVHLPDSAADVSVFLRAIFDSAFFMPFPAKTKVNIIFGCLRLSHKYGVDYLHRRALIHLSSAFPTTLADADACMNGDAPVMTKTSWIDGAGSEILGIHIAREIGALWILPLAFYELSEVAGRFGTEIFHGTSYHGVHASMSAQDQRSFLNGHAEQQLSMTRDILRFLTHPPIAGCTTSTVYVLKRIDALQRTLDGLKADYSSPLYVWSQTDWGTMLEDVCPTCLTVLKETRTTARQAFWDKLPEIYGLPSWEQLEKIKVDAIGTDLLS